MNKQFIVDCYRATMPVSLMVYCLSIIFYHLTLPLDETGGVAGNRFTKSVKL